MYGKVFIVFSSLIALSYGGTLGYCPDADGKAGGTATGVPCELVPGCNFPDNGTLTPLATQCSNDLSDTDCEALFPCTTSTATDEPNCDQATPAAGTAGNPTTYPMVRAQACTSPNLRNIALQCAKQCALCCEAPEYNCDDDDDSPIDCQLNMGKCTDPDWANIMSQYCPHSCGLCDQGTCTDENTGCNSVKSLCKNVDFIDYMRNNCARTCDYCATSPSTPACSDIATNCAPNANLCTNSVYRELMQQQCCATCSRTPSAPAVSCTDTDSNCANWVRNGFCSNSFYSPAQRRQYCGRSCNLC